MQFDLLMVQSPKIIHFIQQCTGVKIKLYKKLIYFIHLENTLYDILLDCIQVGMPLYKMLFDLIQIEKQLYKMLFDLIQIGEPFVLDAFRFDTKIWTKKLQKMACIKCFSIEYKLANHLY